MAREIIQMTPDHYEAVLSLWRSAEGIGLSDADSREAIERYLARNPGMSFVAGEKGQIVGAVLCGHDGRRGYLHHLAVTPSHRRRGIGAALVQQSLAALCSAGIRKCHLFLFADNEEGLAFWQQTGWTPRPELKLISKNL